MPQFKITNVELEEKTNIYNIGEFGKKNSSTSKVIFEYEKAIFFQTYLSPTVPTI